ncbi:MAG: hypothetical protein ACLU4N_19815 [Butyricimonas faecihominis]
MAGWLIYDEAASGDGDFRIIRDRKLFRTCLRFRQVLFGIILLRLMEERNYGMESSWEEGI